MKKIIALIALSLVFVASASSAKPQVATLNVSPNPVVISEGSLFRISGCGYAPKNVNFFLNGVFWPVTAGSDGCFDYYLPAEFNVVGSNTLSAWQPNKGGQRQQLMASATYEAVNG